MELTEEQRKEITEQIKKQKDEFDLNEYRANEIYKIKKQTENWPSALLKASQDPFIYKLKLTSGDEFMFERCEATASGKFALLYLSDPYMDSTGDHNFKSATFDRGVEVNVENIVWVADAPYGS